MSEQKSMEQVEQEVRQAFQDAIERTEDADQRAELELAAAFFLRPDFRAALREVLFQMQLEQ